jgi:hypothetical protein
MFELIEPQTMPVRPDSLTPGGSEMWTDLIEHVAGPLATARDSMLFSQLCNLAAAINEAWASGAAPPATYMSELRRLSELFGIAGVKSRIGRVVAAEPKSNPFAALAKLE